MKINMHLKPMTLENYDTVEPWFNNQGTTKWLKSVYRLGKYNLYTHKLSLNHKTNDFCIGFVETTPIGFVGLSFIDQIDRSAMIWYLIGEKSYQGKGAGTELVRLMVERARAKHQLHSLYASVASSNLASRRVLEKNGFNLMGLQRQCHYIDNKFDDRVLFDFLFDEHRYPQN